jgi:plastocyanin
MRRAALLAVLGLALLAVLGLGLLGAPAAAQHGDDHGAEHGGGGGGGRPPPPAEPGDPATAAASVRIGFAAVQPARVDIVAGATVMWTNDSARVHTVTADDGSFDSGRLASSQTFSHRFTAAGEAPYHCMLHPLIQGVVGVHDLLLEPPSTAASPKRPFVLAGRASSALAAGTPVSVQADATGAGFAPVASTTVGADGTFEARFVPTTTAAYRAVAGELTSPSVDLLVLDRRIALTARHARGHMVLRAKVTPAAPHDRLVLQLYLPERFGWWPVQHARLDDRSTARFVVRARRHLRARVVLTLPDGATRLAVSRTVHVGVKPRSLLVRQAGPA